MSGHSKWHTTRHKKAAIDAKRGKAFTKLAKEISVAARIGGGDPEGNPRLRLAVDKARAVNMPSDNIKRAIQKGTGELPGVTYEEVTYEGYGPGGIALLIDVLTDNRTRTVAEVRHLLGKLGGKMGEPGSVAFLFEAKGYILVEKNKVDEDTLMSLVLDAGAEDMRNEPDEDSYQVITSVPDLSSVTAALEKAEIPVASSEATKLPTTEVEVAEDAVAGQMLRLMDALDDHDDVQNVYANFNIPQAVMDRIG